MLSRSVQAVDVSYVKLRTDAAEPHIGQHLVTQATKEVREQKKERMGSITRTLLAMMMNNLYSFKEDGSQA